MRRLIVMNYKPENEHQDNEQIEFEIDKELDNLCISDLEDVDDYDTDDEYFEETITLQGEMHLFLTAFL